MSNLQITWPNLMAGCVESRPLNTATVDTTQTILNSLAIPRIVDSDLENDLPIGLSDLIAPYDY